MPGFGEGLGGRGTGALRAGIDPPAEAGWRPTPPEAWRRMAWLSAELFRKRASAKPASTAPASTVPGRRRVKSVAVSIRSSTLRSRSDEDTP
jgi:hypothetical protein